MSSRRIDKIEEIFLADGCLTDKRIHWLIARVRKLENYIKEIQYQSTPDFVSNICIKALEESE